MIFLTNIGFCNDPTKNIHFPAPAAPNGHNAVSCMDGGFSLKGEFLWWRAQMGNLDYAFKSGTTISLVPPIVASTKIREPDFSFDPGVRLSLGYDFGKERADLFLKWTYHYTDATDQTGNSRTSGSLISTKDLISENGVLVITSADSGKIQWQTRLNMFDLNMGYEYFIGPRFSVRPFMGLKGTWIDMDTAVNYQSVTGPTSSFSSVRFKNKADYWGVGPQVGVDGSFHLGWGFSIFSNSSIAFVYGNYDQEFKQTTSAGGRITAKHDSFSRQRAIGAIAIGLNWTHCFSNHYLLGFNLGWEGQYFWNQYQFRFAKDSTYHGDLTYTGLNAGIRFDF
ncbi:hypothetical protein NEPTK9_001478 [Candidatus Neptunochlamydia vexilliferae]|uniref:MOMP-like family protein n=2 Tax=Candidatus Neptunichlamydia vexilliferae TaxID=1651774 RepID=A0ABS0B0N8_9BACT|nr:hypothetical protein [Candidatus Neptunochlamydia vexilliferae]